MSYVLDTCVLSELIKKSPEPRLLHWIQTQPEERLYLSVLTLGELQKGVAKLRDSKRKRSLQRWLAEDIQERFKGRLASVTPEVALLWGQIQGQAERRGMKMPVLDGLIAATTLSLGAALVTRDIKGAKASGVEIVNPWKPSEIQKG